MRQKNRLDNINVRRTGKYIQQLKTENGIFKNVITTKMQQKIRKMKIATKKTMTSQHKSYDKQKIQLLDKNTKTTKMQVIPKQKNKFKKTRDVF